MTILAGTIVSPSFADIIEWDGGGNGDSWTTPANWDGDALPGAGDRVLIEGDVDVFIPDNAEITIDSIEIDAEATLSIREEVVLTIEHDYKNVPCPGPAPSCSSVDNHKIDGLILFPFDQADAGTIKFVNNPHLLGGVGTIRSQLFAATIEIDGDVQVTNLLDGTDVFQGNGGIRGSMHIVGNTGTSFDGTFINKGLVIADAQSKPGILITAEIEDDDTSRYVLSDCSNVNEGFWIEFEKGSVGLDGDFVDLGGGEFRFHEDMHTCGTYGRFVGDEDSCGGIDLMDTGITFRYMIFDTDTGDPCDNPGTLSPVSMSCGKPWKVSADVAIVNPCEVCCP